MTFEYTGGRLGTHSITMSKPIGGGVIDIEHVPLDLIDKYSANGYYALDSDGMFPHVGYCIATPDPAFPDGQDCQPATVTPVLFQTPAPVPTSTHTGVVAGAAHPPTRLPDVGSSNGMMVLFPIIVAIVGSAMIEGARHRSWKRRQEFGKHKHNQ